MLFFFPFFTPQFQQDKINARRRKEEWQRPRAVFGGECEDLSTRHIHTWTMPVVLLLSEARYREEWFQKSEKRYVQSTSAPHTAACDYKMDVMMGNTTRENKNPKWKSTSDSRCHVPVVGKQEKYSRANNPIMANPIARTNQTHVSPYSNFRTGNPAPHQTTAAHKKKLISHKYKCSA